jgi:hypothetical protein
VLELQAQAKLGFTQVFHLEPFLEGSHCFLNVLCGANDIQIIDIDQDDAETLQGFLNKYAGAIIIVCVTPSLGGNYSNG